MPGLIASLMLLIAGAVAKYAYSDSVWAWGSDGDQHSIQVETVGMILLIAGALALLISIAYAFKGNNEYEEALVFEEESMVEKASPQRTPRRTTRAKRTTKSD